jgi:hypothetical protein
MSFDPDFDFNEPFRDAEPFFVDCDAATFLPDLFDDFEAISFIAADFGLTVDWLDVSFTFVRVAFLEGEEDAFRSFFDLGFEGRAFLLPTAGDPFPLTVEVAFEPLPGEDLDGAVFFVGAGLDGVLFLPEAGLDCVVFLPAGFFSAAISSGDAIKTDRITNMNRLRSTHNTMPLHMVRHSIRFFGH